MGHDFGDVQTQRDRRERGDEVVVTVREYRECDRCGETRTVSENTEVRTAGRGESPDAEPSGADSEVTAGEEYEDVSADEDDGVILPDEPGERQPGAWPAEAEQESEPTASTEEPEPWPDVEGEDEGFAAESADETPLEGVEFGSGLTPEASGEAGEADAGGDVVESTPPASGRRTGSATAGGSPQRTVTAETELVCPECEHTAPIENASLRPGDICPECHRGYLTERSR